MSSIIEAATERSQWRKRYKTAYFRAAAFHTEADSRSSGRRVVLHQYPKRNVPYSEDMGRQAVTFQIRGYLIGPNYHILKDILIAALEEDGPGTLRVSMPYLGQTLEVMAGPYTITERRELGGFCEVDMEFMEYGTPGNTAVSGSQVAQNGPSVIDSAKTYMENQGVGNTITQQQAEQLWQQQYQQYQDGAANFNDRWYGTGESPLYTGR